MTQGVDVSQSNPRPMGRPCSTCAHPQRQQIEAALLDGEPVSTISATHGLSRQSIRRHRAHHLVLESGWSGAALDGATAAAKLHATALRLADLADQAEDAGKIGDAVRALQAQAKVLTLIATDQPLDVVTDLNKLGSAVAQLIWADPTLGHRLVAELNQFDASAELHGAFVRVTERAEQRMKELQQ